MKTESKPMEVRTYLDKIEKGKISLNHILQRESGRWKPAQKKKLIDSILRGYPIPQMYAVRDKNDENQYYILDGKQRLSTLLEFVNNNSFKFEGVGKYTINNQEQEVSGKFKDLSEDVKEKIKGTEIICTVFSDCTDEEILEVFARYNNGTNLSPAEKRKALMGNDMISWMNDIIKGEENDHFFDKTGMSKGQKVKSECYDVLIQILMLMKDGPSELSDRKMGKFIIENRDNITEEERSKLNTLLKKLGDMIDKMQIPKDKPKNNPIKKISLAPIIAVMNKLDEEQYPAFEKQLEEFFTNIDKQEEYREACSRPADKAKVIIRFNTFLKMADLPEIPSDEE